MTPILRYISVAAELGESWRLFCDSSWDHELPPPREEIRRGGRGCATTPSCHRQLARPCCRLLALSSTAEAGGTNTSREPRAAASFSAKRNSYLRPGSKWHRSAHA